MALSIKNPETERLARARSTPAKVSLSRRGLRSNSVYTASGLLEDLAASRRRWRNLPVLDARSADEIVGYNESGLPG